MRWIVNCNGNKSVKVRGVTKLDGARGKKQVWAPTLALRKPTWIGGRNVG